MVYIHAFVVFIYHGSIVFIKLQGNILKLVFFLKYSICNFIIVGNPRLIMHRSSLHQTRNQPWVSNDATLYACHLASTGVGWGNRCQLTIPLKERVRDLSTAIFKLILILLDLFASSLYNCVIDLLIPKYKFTVWMKASNSHLSTICTY